MENKKYLDKVVDHMVRNTVIEEYMVFVKHPINNVEKFIIFGLNHLVHTSLIVEIYTKVTLMKTE